MFLNKKHINSLIYLFITIAVVYVFFQMYSQKKENTKLYNIVKILENNISFQKSSNEGLLNKAYLRFKVNNTQINDCFIYNDSNDSCLLSELISTHKIILHYSSLSCLDCVDQELKKIKSLSKEIGNENVIILASYYNMRDLHIFKRVNGLVNNSVYRISENVTGLVTDSLNIPTLMVIDSSLIIKELFFPDSNYPEASSKYYNIIVNKYF